MHIAKNTRKTSFILQSLGDLIVAHKYALVCGAKGRTSIYRACLKVILLDENSSYMDRSVREESI